MRRRLYNKGNQTKSPVAKKLIVKLNICAAKVVWNRWFWNVAECRLFLFRSFIRVQTLVWLKSFLLLNGFILRITGFFSSQVYRGEFACPRKGCLKLNVLIVANLLLCRLNPQKANQFTVERVSRNAEVNNKKCLVWAQGLTWKMRGQYVEITGREERK